MPRRLLCGAQVLREKKPGAVVLSLVPMVTTMELSSWKIVSCWGSGGGKVDSVLLPSCLPLADKVGAGGGGGAMCEQQP